MENISKDAANKHFYIQMLMGDSGDNIPGLRGIGKSGANKILKDCKTEYSLFRTTVCKYKSIEDTILTKELSVITKRIKAELDDIEIDTSESVYKGLDGVKLERKIRINSKKEIKTILEEVMPGGWRAYFDQQYKLLRMLTEETDDITIQEVQENPVKKDEESIEAAKEALRDDSVSDFLTI